MMAPSKTPLLQSGGGKESDSAGPRLSEAEPCPPAAWGWLQVTWGGSAPGACHGASWLAAMLSWRERNGSFVFSAQWLSFMALLCYSCSVGCGQIQEDNLYPKANWL